MTSVLQPKSIYAWRVRKALAREVEAQTARAIDRTGADPDMLHTLNDLYVNAFRNSDVAWYDAHLTPDYGVTGGAGTHQDLVPT